MLSKKIIYQVDHPVSKNWVLLFVMVTYVVETMERLNSGEFRHIFGRILNDPNIGLMKMEENNRDVLLPAYPQELYPSVNESWLMLSQKFILQSITQCQKKTEDSLFVMVTHVEKTMDYNSGISSKILNDPKHWSDENGRAQWQKAQETSKDFNIVLIHHDKKFFYLRALQSHWSQNNDWFQTNSSTTFIKSDVQSIYTPSQIQDW